MGQMVEHGIIVPLVERTSLCFQLICTGYAPCLVLH